MAAVASGKRDAAPTKRRIDEYVEDIYGLSPTQQGMLLHTVWDAEAAPFFQQMVLRLEDLDVDAFTTAWQRVLDRHPVLRSSFHWEGLTTPVQVVHRGPRLPVQTLDWRAVPAGAQEDRLRTFLRSDRQRGFKLTDAPLLRLTLIRLGDRRYLCVKSNHHLLLDAWSGATVVKEVQTVYHGLRRGRDVHLPEPAPYRDYISWLQWQDLEAAEEFWRTELAGFTEATPLPGERPPGPLARPTVRFVGHRAIVSGASTAALQALAQRLRVTLSAIVQGAWAVLLSIWSAQEDVVFGTTVSGRPAELEGVENMVGLFINALPLRVRVRPELALAPWLQELHAHHQRLQDHQHTPPAQIQSWSGIRPGAPVFETLVTFNSQSIGWGPARRGQRERIPVEEAAAREPARADPTSQPLSLIAVEAGDGLFLDLTADLRRTDPTVPVRLLEQLRRLLEAIASGEARTLGDLSPMAPAERDQVVHDWNRTRTDYPRNRCLHELFEATARRSPDAPAVAVGGETLSYDALNRRANRLAHYLRELGVGPEVLVGLSARRSLATVTAVLAILKAGGGYVPLDPDYPASRIELMLDDSGATLVLTDEWLADDERWRDYDEADLAPAARPENVAFVIYTSGSTGTPKGVVVPHRVCVSRVNVEPDPFRPGDVLAGKTSLNFIDSVWELFGAWAHGLLVVLIPPDRVADSAQLVDALAEARVTRIVLVPSLLRTILESGEPLATRLPRLEHWISSGEPLPPDLSAAFAEQLPDRVLTNLYGLSETWDATRCDSRQHRAEDGLPIGRAIGNCTVYVLDRLMRPLPIGVAGELYVGGEMLARGYHRRPALTAERFLPDPFSDRPGARLYRTGDRARWRPDGQLECVGRLDHQLKLRGYRIEPAEVESTLRRHPGVQQAVVTTTAQQQLLAYVVPAGEETPAADELRRFARRRLPDHMVPSAFIELDSLPLTPSGKIDRRALPERDATPERRRQYVAPRNPDEAAVAAVWSEVLGVAQVGVEDDFFELGGHSLLATQVLARLRSRLQVRVPVQALFGSPTVAGVAGWIEANRAAAAVDAAPPLNPGAPAGDGGREAPQSFAQRRMWFLAQLAPGSALYTTQTVTPLRGPLDRDALQRAVDALVERHEALRTTFDMGSDGEPIQVVAPAARTQLSETDLSAVPAGERQSRAQRILRSLSEEPFDLARGPLVRFALVRLGAQRQLLAWTMHHIVTDGWSIAVMRRELLALYEAFRVGAPSPLPDPPMQYADFAIWQQEWLQGDELADRLAYWTDTLRGVVPLELPIDRPRPRSPRYRSASVPVRIDEPLRQRLSALARAEDATPFMVVLAAFQFLLSRYCGQDDVVVGTPAANRTHSELEGVVGLFANTLAIRTQVQRTNSFRQLLGRVRRACLGAYAHQELPFEMLVDELAPQRDLSRQPLVQVLFVLESATQPVDEAAAGPPRVAGGPIYFDLTLAMTDTPAGLAGELHYDSDLFDGATVERMAGHLLTLLVAIAAEPDARLSAAAMITDAERARLLESPRDAPAPDRCAHVLVEDAADRAPEDVAVEFEGASLTYAELDARANALAHRLREHGVERETAAAAVLERGPEAIVAMLGIFKAGGIFVPLDPELPADRLRWQLEDAGAAVVVTEAALRGALPETAATVVEVADAADTTRPAVGVAPQDAAYVIYTSGTTGRPKGVVVEHRNLAHTIAAQVPLFGLTSSSRVLATIAPGFDASLGEVLRTLTAGATLVLARREELLPGPGLIELLRTRRITTVTLPTSVLAALPVEAELPDLVTLTVGGEPLSRELASCWNRGRRMLNGYGPTEATIGATLAVDWDRTRRPPIGHPLPRVRARVLDAAMELLPEGVPGELFLGGPGVARGYHRRPGTTAERFVPDPFSTEPGARLYRTGDLVRRLGDGQLEFRGRADRQVKIRGHRIEPDEVASVLREHAHVGDAAVVARPAHGGEARLVAYVVPADRDHDGNGSGDGVIADVRQHLVERLPDYMVPAVFVPLAALPLTVHGKLDDAALPTPDGQAGRLAATSDYVMPRTPSENVLAAIWEDLLGIDQVGVHDNFFELGGDSILGIRVIARANQAGLRLTTQDVYRLQTVAEQAAAAETGEAVVADQGPVTGDVPLTPIQRWYFDGRSPEPHHWNWGTFLPAPAGISAGALGRALTAVLEHHDALRLRFVRADSGDWRQFLAEPAGDPPLSTFDLSQVPPRRRRAAVDAAVADLQPTLDLADGPVIRLAWFDLGDDRPGQLALIVHHLVVDTVSWPILLGDLSAALRQAIDGRPIALPPKTSSFKAWAEHLRDRARSGLNGDEERYWLDALRRRPAPLPLDRPGGRNTRASGEEITVTLDEDETRRLRQLARSTRSAVDEVLLAVFAKTIADWAGGTRVLVNVERHGRHDAGADLNLSRTVGWFACIAPVTLEVAPDASPRELLDAVTRQWREVPNRGLGYGLLRYLATGAAADELTQLGDPEVFLCYHGERRGTSRSRGLPHLKSEAGDRRHVLEINAVLDSDRLRVRWGYSAELHERATIDRLIAAFARNLQATAAPATPEASTLQAASMTGVDLSDAELTMLVKQIDAN